MSKVRAVWAHLSEDEPENQLPPANLEQLISMIGREMARRFVHLANYSASAASKLPSYAVQISNVAVQQVSYLLDIMIKVQPSI